MLKQETTIGREEGELWMKKCPECQREYADRIKFCPRDGSALQPVDTSRGDPLLGRIIGGTYEVLEFLGGGGFGNVYKVKNLRLDDIEALKIIHPALLREQESIERFQREAKLLRKLGGKSSHIVHLYVLQEDKEEGFFYFTMEYVDGLPLTRTIRSEGSMHVVRALELTRQICQALEVAHAQGVVHRDMKLDNILLTRDAEEEQVKILDFGIAKVLGQQSLSDLSRGMPGTAGYAAPEQIKGESDRISAATDLFATGVILFNMLTGRDPWSGTPVGEPLSEDGNWEIIEKTLEEVPIPARQLNPEIPKELETIINRLLQKDPALRFASAAELDRALVRLLSTLRLPEQPVSAAEPSHEEPGIPVPSTRVTGPEKVLEPAERADDATASAGVTQEEAAPKEVPATRGIPIPGRLRSIDAFRGATVAAMILISYPGSWNHVYPALRLAEWHGWTLADLAFPFFLFSVGLALPIFLRRHRARGIPSGELVGRVIKQSLLIFALGLILAVFPRFSDWDTLRIMGILQRIGIVYLVASVLYLLLKPLARWLAVGGLVFGYWALMTQVPVPGFGAGDLSPAGNLAGYLDRLVLGQAHLWLGGPSDPEGLLSTLPALATALLGTFVGEWLMAERGKGVQVMGLLGAAVAAIAVGLLWDLVFPINKSLWTSSFVLFTAGAATLAFAVFYGLIEYLGWRTWCRPFEAYGANAIAALFGAQLVASLMLTSRWPAPAGETSSCYDWIYTRVFAAWLGPLNGSLAFALAYVTFWLLIMWYLHWRRIYFRV